MLTLRPIRPEDNAAVKALILRVMGEFSCLGDGFSSSDAELDDMYAAYRQPGCAFYVLTEDGGRVVGTGGYGPLPETSGVCELRKMYLLGEVRGKGGGKTMLTACLQGAREAGYDRMYLETVRQMTRAAELYVSFGFQPLDGPMGRTGHCGCDRFLVKELI